MNHIGNSPDLAASPPHVDHLVYAATTQKRNTLTPELTASGSDRERIAPVFVTSSHHRSRGGGGAASDAALRMRRPDAHAGATPPTAQIPVGGIREGVSDAMTEDRFRYADGATIAYQVSGSGSPPVAYAHGVLLSRAAVRGLGILDVEAIADGRRPLLYDQRGHGHSTGRPQPEYYTFEQAGVDLLDLLTAAGFEVDSPRRRAAAAPAPIAATPTRRCRRSRRRCRDTTAGPGDSRPPTPRAGSATPVAGSAAARPGGPGGDQRGRIDRRQRGGGGQVRPRHPAQCRRGDLVAGVR